MRVAYDLFAWPGVLLFSLGIVLVVALATALVLGSFARGRAENRFGEASLVGKLVSHDSTTRRTIKGSLLVIAMAFALFSLARPQYGRGQKLVPATNIDVVIVLDYSKSMYARDVTPSRTVRAKAEVARLIDQLPGARFGAVAFAGEPMSFPLTTDGGAIAQFFRQLEPNDMPVGGTATARALEQARELLRRDPSSKDHARVILLVTDGEDLEGDPVSVAEECKKELTVIDVVQIGGRAPEVIPDVGPDGKVLGLRKDEDGKPMTTELSADGERQLASIANTTGGMIVRSEHGETGIDKVSAGLSKMMREDLSERVEYVYNDVFYVPLGIALVLLVAEALLFEAPRRRRRRA